jgi:hypothetical protein
LSENFTRRKKKILYKKGRKKFQALHDLAWHATKHKVLSQNTHELLGFMFRELLSQLIEISLLLKKEQNEYKLHLGLQLKDMSAYNRVKQNPFETHLIIQPAEVLEACRRCDLTKNSTLLKRFHKSVAMTPNESHMYFF